MGMTRTVAWGGWMCWDVVHADRVVAAYRTLRDHGSAGTAARLLVAHLPHDPALPARLRGASVVAVSLATLVPEAAVLDRLRDTAPVRAEVLGGLPSTDPKSAEAGLLGPLRAMELPDLAVADDAALDLLLLVLADRSTCPLVLGSLGSGPTGLAQVAPGAAGLAVALARFDRTAHDLAMGA